MSDREEQGCRPISGVDWESGVKRLNGKPEQLYRRLLSKFVSGYGMRESVSGRCSRPGSGQGPTPSCIPKGVAGNLSLVPLADYVLAVEQAVKHDDVSHEGELIDAMDWDEALIGL
ncbi:MAG: Hpt domain-containing protein [Bilophila sp.]